MPPVRVHALRVHGHDLPGVDIPDKSRTDGVQRAALRGKYRGAVRKRSHAQRPKAVDIPRCDQLGRRGDHQRVSALEHIHGVGHGSLHARAAQTGAHDRIGDDLGIGSGVEKTALFFQRAAQFPGVGEVAVVGKCHASLVMVDEQRLNVAAAV